MSAPLNSQQFPDQPEHAKKKERTAGIGVGGYPLAFVGYGVGYVGVGGGYGGGAMTTTGTSGGYDAANDAAQGAAEQTGADAGNGTAGLGDAAGLGDTPST